jgi:hypothetical protein
MNHMLKNSIVGALLVLGSFGVPAKEPPTKSQFPKVAFTHKLNPDQSPSDKAEAFAQEDTIYLSMELKGQPKTGKAVAKFFYLEQLIDESEVDVATLPASSKAGKGGNTFVGFNLKPGSPLPVGVGCRAELSWNGKAVGAYPFVIAPPAGAIASKLAAVKLARGVTDDFVPVSETKEFGTDEKVFLVGSGQFGIESRFWVDWFVAGKLDEAGTKSFSLTANKEKLPFSFSFLPAGGWPVGTHEVVMMLDGKEAVREKFTIKSTAPEGSKMSEFQKGLKGLTDELRASKNIRVVKVLLFKDDGSGKPGEVVEGFTTKDLHLHAEFKLDLPANISGSKAVWSLVKAGKHQNVPLASVEITDKGLNDFLQTDAKLDGALPAGDYKVELIRSDKVLGEKVFQIK